MPNRSCVQIPEIALVFFKELKRLGIIPIRCGVGQIDDETRTTSLTTTLWPSPVANDWIKIKNSSASGYNIISGNGKLIEGSSTFNIYYGESFEFRYNGTSWVAF